MLLNVPIPFLRRGSNTQGTSMTAVYALGTVYGLAGVCAGPLLGAVLTVAAVSGTPLSGGIIVLVFALGMTLPLLILSLLWGRFPAIRTLVRPREVKVGPWSNTWTGIIGGVLTIGVGILLLVTAGTTELTGFLGAGTQAELEGSVLGWAGQIPDIVVVLVVVAVAAVALLLVRSRKKRAPAASTAPDMPLPEVSMPLVGACTKDDDDDEQGSGRWSSRCRAATPSRRPSPPGRSCSPGARRCWPGSSPSPPRASSRSCPGTSRTSPGWSERSGPRSPRKPPRNAERNPAHSPSRRAGSAGRAGGGS